MKITKKDIEYISHLSRLEVDDSLVDKFADQVSRILQYIDKLKDVDVSGVELMSGATLSTNVFREDIAHIPPGPSVTLANAPERDDDFYIVPKAVG
ncbi:MAG: Asp-tRNA(Asn)/Glu-tRNA(Gln) amidotransferase subunit GatC [Desulfobacterium sp.]